MEIRKPFGCITVADAAVVLDVPEEMLTALFKSSLIPCSPLTATRFAGTWSAASCGAWPDGRAEVRDARLGAAVRGARPRRRAATRHRRHELQAAARQTAQALASTRACGVA